MKMPFIASPLMIKFFQTIASVLIAYLAVLNIGKIF